MAPKLSSDHEKDDTAKRIEVATKTNPRRTRAINPKWTQEEDDEEGVIIMDHHQAFEATVTTPVKGSRKGKRTIKPPQRALRDYSDPGDLSTDIAAANYSSEDTSGDQKKKKRSPMLTAGYGSTGSQSHYTRPKKVLPSSLGNIPMTPCGFAACHIKGNTRANNWLHAMCHQCMATDQPTLAVTCARGASCHKCPMAHRQIDMKDAVMVKSNKCYPKSYCRPCIAKWYPEYTEEDVVEKCFFCRGICNCKACMKVSLGAAMEYRPKDEDNRSHLVKVLQGTFPTLQILIREEDTEMEHEKEIRKGGDVAPEYEEHPKGMRVKCDLCQTSLVNVYRRCTNEECGFEICIHCCKDVRERSAGHDHDHGHDQGGGETSSLWLLNPDGSIPCPRESDGYGKGCGSRAGLRLCSFFPKGHLRSLDARVRRVMAAKGPALSLVDGGIDSGTQICCKKCESSVARLENALSSARCQAGCGGVSERERVEIENRFNLRRAADRPGSHDNFILCPAAVPLDSEEENRRQLAHFQEAWSKGRPVIIRNVMDGSDNLSWHPHVLWRACRFMGKRGEMLEDNKEVTAIDCLYWEEGDMKIKTFFEGYLSGIGYPANVTGGERKQKKKKVGRRGKGRKRKSTSVDTLQVTEESVLGEGREQEEEEEEEVIVEKADEEELSVEKGEEEKKVQDEEFINFSLVDWPMLLKLKDWPPGSDFLERLPRHGAEFVRLLPLHEYTHPTHGKLNLATYLPDKGYLKPDLGPKMYCAYGFRAELPAGNSVTKLHCDMADAVNILLHVHEVTLNPGQLKRLSAVVSKMVTAFEKKKRALQKGRGVDSRKRMKVAEWSPAALSADSAAEEGQSESEQEDEAAMIGKLASEAAAQVMAVMKDGDNGVVGGAIWQIFRREDSRKLEEYLLENRYKFLNGVQGTPLEKVDHPIHDQSFFLDASHLAQLKKEKGIEPWTFHQSLGEAVFIPAGCPHQVRNTKSCVKVALDFVSPENVGQCVRLTQEFRRLPEAHRANEDKLEVMKVMVHAISKALKELNKILGL